MKDTQVRGGYVLHVGVVEGTLRVGDKLCLQVDGVSGVGWWVGLVDGVSGRGLVGGASGWGEREGTSRRS